MNVSFNVNFIPSLSLKKKKSSKLFRSAPRHQLKKLTNFNSSLSLRSNHANNNANDAATTSETMRKSSGSHLLSLKSSIQSLRKYASSLHLIGEQEDNGQQDGNVNVSYADLMQRFDILNESVGAQREFPGSFNFDELLSSSSSCSCCGDDHDADAEDAEGEVSLGLGLEEGEFDQSTDCGCCDDTNHSIGTVGDKDGEGNGGNEYGFD
ncbi:unnamed protein product [Ambrosiozyma monospora]|uniref:Unnamed protein product n=1 Tax=Ambrosiozyma monospora TaxID=43982 RepID=A0ACB5U4R9_AMBMO|nr:unnamed protein product [Ambrosiozyma monospora]